MQTLDINGAQVGYVETGSGESPIVFVHGWSCDDTFFAPQAGRQDGSQDARIGEQ